MSKRISNSVKRQQGVSLVELMVAMTLGLILTGAIIQLMTTNSSNFQLQSAMTEVQQSAVYSMRYFTDEIRKAGYSGDMRSLNQPLWQNGINRVASRSDSGMSNALDGLDNRWKRRMGYFDVTSDQVPPFIMAGDFSLDSGQAISSDRFTIQYLGQSGETTCAGDPITGNVVITTTFFVENGNLRCTAYRPDADGSGNITVTTDSLMENVDNFQVLYGIDFQRGSLLSAGHESGIGEAEVFVNATEAKAILSNSAIYDAGNAPNIVAVRVGLLLSSGLNTRLDSQGQQYQVLDNLVTDEDLSADGSFRRLFTTTVQLLNVPRSI